MKTLIFSIIGFISASFINLSFSYNENLSYRMVYYDMISYCKTDTIQNWSCGSICDYLNVTDISVIENYKFNTKAFIAYDNELESTVVSFRGTEPLSIKNWISDLDFIKEPYKLCNSCEVHAGFYNIYKSIREDLIFNYNKYIKKYGNKVYITGHSLGGAIAHHFVADLKSNNFDLRKTIVYTFGMPRTGNKNFSNYLSDVVHYRVTHNADPVPHILLIDLGFWHTSQEIWYTEDNKSFKQCSIVNGEDTSCSDSLILDLDIIDHVTYLGQDFTKNFLQCS